MLPRIFSRDSFGLSGRPANPKKVTMRPCPGGDSKVALHDSGRTKETIGLFSGSLNVSAKAERLTKEIKKRELNDG
jgi:hypothetical protein